MSSGTIQHINKRDINRIYGYVRSKVKCHVPTVIINVILIFFYEFDYFMQCGNNIQIHDKKIILMKCGGGGCRGTLPISRDSESNRFLFKWILKLDECPGEDAEIAFGIIDCPDNYLNKFYASSNTQHNWHYSMTGAPQHIMWATCTSYSGNGPDQYAHIKLIYHSDANLDVKIGDKITLEVDTELRKLRIYVNDNKGGFSYKINFGLNRKYYLITYINGHVGTSVELISFNKILK